MSTEVKFRRGTNAEMGSFTGAAGEAVIDTDNDRWYIHDGATAGGFPQASAADVQDGAFDYAAGSGSNTITVTLSPAPDAYATGGTVSWKQATTNTGSATINANGLGAKTLKKFSGTTKSNLEADDLPAGAIFTARYDGTDMILVGGGLGGGGGGQWELIERQSVSGVTTVTFTTGLSGYDRWMLTGDGVISDAPSITLEVVLSDDTGSSYYTAGYDGAGVSLGAGSQSVYTSATDAFSIHSSVLEDHDTDGDSSFGFDLTVFGPESADDKLVNWRSTQGRPGSGNKDYVTWGGGILQQAAVMDALKVQFSGAGNMSGAFQLLGLKNT